MKCFYHRGDFDGKCAGAIVKLAHPECEMIGIEYGDAFPWDCIEQGEPVVMVDFCLEPFEDMVRLAELADLTWIDHHKSAIEARDRAAPVLTYSTELPPMEAPPISPFVNGVQVVGQAACELAWNYFIPGEENPMPLAVHLLGRYDVWDHSHPAVLAFQYGMRVSGSEYLPTDEFGWTVLFDDTRLVRDIIDRGRVALDYERQHSELYLREFGFLADIVEGGFFVRAYCLCRGLANSMSFASMPPVPVEVLCAYVQRPDGRWRVSLYRPEGGTVDCSEIAKAFGGGGHAGAAGFICEKLDWMQRVTQ